VQGQNIPAKPEPARLVNDFAEILTPAEEQLFEDSLVAFDRQTSTQIAVVTVPTLDDYPIEDYANKLFRAWGIGQKDKNNGILFLIAPNDRKMRIEVGYGLEGAFPDMIAADIIDGVKPYFKTQNYGAGIGYGLFNIKAQVKGEYTASTDYKDKYDKAARKGKTKSGKGLGILGWAFILLLLFLFIRFPSAMLGFLLGMLASGGRGGRGGGGNWNNFSGGSGGFGGFGGGSSGGGGASGDW
jgi:uncharacterized protein